MCDISDPTRESKGADGKETAAANRLSLAWISLPKDGGFIRGIGEKFAAKPVTSTASMKAPIYTNPDRYGFGPQPALFAYAVAAVAVGGAVVATLGLGSAVKNTPTLFFCSIVLSSWFGGVGPGIFAGLLSAIALDYYFIPPIYALGISIEEAPDMIAFVASAFIVSWLSGEQKLAKHSVREAWDKLDAKACEKTSKLGQTQDRSQVRTAPRRTAEEGLRRTHAKAARVKLITGEPTAPITDERTERIAQTGELVRAFSSQTPAAEKIEAGLLYDVGESVAHAPTLHPVQEAVFLRQGDYWTVQYQGQIARFKASRGLQYLASLLGHPGREFHVSELIAPVRKGSVAPGADSASGTSTEDESQMRPVRFQDAGPILDTRAKAEYACRLAELREALDDAERLNDLELAARVQQERDCIADQLALAVGLGGRTRKAGSHAERARSAVTKSIKDSIHKIAEAMPALGRHLGTRIKTGYFCSYNPHPDRPVWWKLAS
jgi:Domain of unknown function (DUF4118)